jgi:hypothetical protein
MSQYHLAQVNVGRFITAPDDPILRDFFDYLPIVNAIADSAPGFVWRFQSSEGNATSFRAYEDDRITINFSVWESMESLRNFVYRGDHQLVMRKKRQWFENMSDQYQALWWVPAGHIPTWLEAKRRLDHVRKHGESAHSFTFRKIFTPQGELL